MKREVAIKVLPQSLAADPQALARFKGEAVAAARAELQQTRPTPETREAYLLLGQMLAGSISAAPTKATGLYRAVVGSANNRTSR